MGLPVAFGALVDPDTPSGSWDLFGAGYSLEVVDLALTDASYKFGELPFDSFSYGREPNAYSTASVSFDERQMVMDNWMSEPLTPWRHNLRIRRNGIPVWGGPITSITRNSDGRAIVQASDFSVWTTRRFLPYDVRVENPYTYVIEEVPDFGPVVYVSNSYKLLMGSSPVVALTASADTPSFYGPTSKIVPRLDVWSKVARDAWSVPTGALQPPHALESGRVLSGFPVQGSRRTEFEEPMELSIGSLRSIYDHFQDINNSRAMRIRWTTLGVQYVAAYAGSSPISSASTVTSYDFGSYTNISLDRSTYDNEIDGSSEATDLFFTASQQADGTIDDRIVLFQTYGPQPGIPAPAPIPRPDQAVGLTYASGRSTGVLHRNVTGEYPAFIPGLDYPEGAQAGDGYRIEFTQGAPVGPNDLVPHKQINGQRVGSVTISVEGASAGAPTTEKASVDLLPTEPYDY